MAQGDPAASQRHAFSLQPESLCEHPAHPRAPADAAGGVHHTVPGQIRRAFAHRLSDRPRASRPSELL